MHTNTSHGHWCIQISVHGSPGELFHPIAFSLPRLEYNMLRIDWSECCRWQYNTGNEIELLKAKASLRYLTKPGEHFGETVRTSLMCMASGGRFIWPWALSNVMHFPGELQYQRLSRTFCCSPKVPWPHFLGTLQRLNHWALVFLLKPSYVQRALSWDGLRTTVSLHWWTQDVNKVFPENKKISCIWPGTRLKVKGVVSGKLQAELVFSCYEWISLQTSREAAWLALRFV